MTFVIAQPPQKDTGVREKCIQGASTLSSELLLPGLRQTAVALLREDRPRWPGIRRVQSVLQKVHAMLLKLSTLHMQGCKDTGRNTYAN